MRLVTSYRIRVMGEGDLPEEERGPLYEAVNRAEEIISDALPEGFYVKIEDAP